MINEVKNLEDLKGKTIAETQQYLDELWLKFTDGTFAVMVIGDRTEGFGYEKKVIDLNQYSKDKTDHILVDFKLITEEEFKEACNLEHQEYEKRQEEQEKREVERIKNIELAQLEQLKSKYSQ